MSITHLKEGDKAPDFSLKNQDGKTISLNDYKGKKLVLYFYPKDLTPGCTTQSCGLRDNYDLLKKQGFEIMGISADSEKSHQKFIEKHQLPFDLLVDDERKMMNDYGVFGLKKFMGKTYDGIHRTTFLIDENGLISEVIKVSATKAHLSWINN
jgi:peroxiredoxin Q/BCP